MSEDDRDSSHKPQSGVKRVLGPVRPLVHAEAEPAENASLQQFLEREARMKDASQVRKHSDGAYTFLTYQIHSKEIRRNGIFHK